MKDEVTVVTEAQNKTFEALKTQLTQNTETATQLQENITELTEAQNNFKKFEEQLQTLKEDSAKTLKDEVTELTEEQIECVAQAVTAFGSTTPAYVPEAHAAAL